MASIGCCLRDLSSANRPDPPELLEFEHVPLFPGLPAELPTRSLIVERRDTVQVSRPSRRVSVAIGLWAKERNAGDQRVHIR